LSLACATILRVSTATISPLETRMFAVPEAARLLQLSPSTLSYWLDGGIRRDRKYPPVIREYSSGSRLVTWGEFVEAALLRQYRKVHNVPMAELRIVIDHIRQKFGVPYPLAHRQPFVGAGRRLLLEAQDFAGLPGDFWLVAVAGKQPLLTPPSESYFTRVEWNEDIATGWNPSADTRSPVRMRPDERFGLPAVGGIKTEVVWEHLESEYTFEEVAEEFDLSVDEVRWAHAFETSRRAA
jgi:uncharacterized protein (DUF433 family)